MVGGASLASVALAVVPACLAEAAALRTAADGERCADMVLDRLLARLDLGLQACPRAHRTPALDSHVKIRTNKATRSVTARAGQLAELLNVGLKW